MSAVAMSWEPGDGTRWLYFRDLGIWTGWVPGEDGQWTYDDEDFRRIYRDAPDDLPL